MTIDKKDRKELLVVSADQPYKVKLGAEWANFEALANSNGMGYGLFSSSYSLLVSQWERLNEVEKGSLLINMYENLLEPGFIGREGQYKPTEYIELLKWFLMKEKNQLKEWIK